MSFAKIISNENNISINVAVEAVNNALIQCANRQYGKDCLFEVKPESVVVVQYYNIVDNVMDEDNEIIREMAEGMVDDSYYIENNKLCRIVDIKMGRSEILVFKQFLKKLLSLGIKSAIESEHEDMFGKTYSCSVTGVEKRFYHVSFSSGREGILPKSKCIRGERIKRGDRVDAQLINDSSHINHNYVFSRIEEDFAVSLLKKEVPDIEIGVVSIDAYSRNAGRASYVIVSSNDHRCDPVYTCIGRQGVRIKEVTDSMNGEYIKLISNTGDNIEMMLTLIKEGSAESVVYDEDKNIATVIVAKGVYIANQQQIIDLFGRDDMLKIEFITAENFCESNENRDNIIKYLASELNCEEDLAGLIVDNGFNSISEMKANKKDFKEMMLDYLEPDNVVDILEIVNKLSSMHKLNLMENPLSEFSSIDDEMIYILNQKKIKVLDEIADLDSFELSEMIPYAENAEVSGIIMKAREDSGWF